MDIWYNMITPDKGHVWINITDDIGEFYPFQCKQCNMRAARHYSWKKDCGYGYHDDLMANADDNYELTCAQIVMRNILR